MIGIYKIINEENGKFYIGSSKNIEKRFKRHLNELNKGTHHSIHFQRAFNLNKNMLLKLEVIEECDLNNIVEKEQYYLNLLEPWKTGYNTSKLASGGDLISNHPNKEEIYKKIGNTIKQINAKLNDEEWDKKFCKYGEDNYNWKGGISTLTYICLGCGETKPYDKKYKNEYCNQCRPRSGENNSFFGKKHTEETRKNLSIKHKGKKLTDEAKEKCKIAALAYWADDNIEKYQYPSGEKHVMFGKKHTEESRKKMSLSRLEKTSKKTIEERIVNKKFVIKFENLYFVSYKDCTEYTKLSDGGIKNRCISTKYIYKEYEYIYLDKLTELEKECVIIKLKETYKIS